MGLQYAGQRAIVAVKIKPLHATRSVRGRAAAKPVQTGRLSVALNTIAAVRIRHLPVSEPVKGKAAERQGLTAPRSADIQAIAVARMGHVEGHGIVE